MTTSSTTANSALTSILGNLSNNSSSSNSSSSSTAGPLITTGQINVAQLVSELMLVQSQPLVQLQTQEAGVKSTLSAYGQEQSALASLQTAAAALALPSAFQAASATVSGSGIAASVTGTPANANYSVAVTNLAQAQSDAFAAVPSATTPLTDAGGNAAAGTISITQGANTIQVAINAGNDTLAGIASAINSAAGGTVNASVVTSANGSAQLVLASANTGAANAFTVAATDTTGTALSGLVAGMTQTQPAKDAAFTVNGLSVTSASNTVTTAISGVTLNLMQAGTTSQLQIGTDPTAITKSVSDFIGAYNSLISLTNSLTNFNTTTKTASVLTGDTTTRTMVGTLQGILGSQWSTTGSGPSWLAQIGVSVNADGTLTLNSTQFQAALSANPTAVQNMFTAANGTGAQQGFAVQVDNAVQQMLGTSGALGAAQASLQQQVTYLDNQQASMQAQLAQTQASLTQQYSALNAEVSAAQAQQASLTNELANLPG